MSFLDQGSYSLHGSEGSHKTQEHAYDTMKDAVNYSLQLSQMFIQPCPPAPCSYLGLQKFCTSLNTVKFLRNAPFKVSSLYSAALGHIALTQHFSPLVSQRSQGFLGFPMFYGHWPHDTALDAFLFSLPPKHLFFGIPFPNPEGSAWCFTPLPAQAWRRKMWLEGQDMRLCLRPRRGAQVGVASSAGLTWRLPKGGQQKSQSVEAGKTQSSLAP